MITYVAELRFFDLDEAVVRKLEDAVREHAQSMGLTEDQVEIHVHDANVKFQWKLPDLASDAPSQAQLGYARKLLAELKSKAGDNAQAVQLVSDILSEFKSGNVTKRAMSPIIDAMKDAIADLDFTRQGLRTLED